MTRPLQRSWPKYVGKELKGKLVGMDNLTDLQVKVEEGMGQSVWLSMKL